MADEGQKRNAIWQEIDAVKSELSNLREDIGIMSERVAAIPQMKGDFSKIEKAMIHLEAVVKSELEGTLGRNLKDFDKKLDKVSGQILGEDGGTSYDIRFDRLEQFKSAMTVLMTEIQQKQGTIKTLMDQGLGAYKLLAWFGAIMGFIVGSIQFFQLVKPFIH